MLLLLVSILFTSRASGILKVVNMDLSVSSYDVVIKNEALVDKTLLIKELDINRVQLITAPRRFGKTTNMNMIKAFFSLQVDSRGEPIQRNRTSNYRLFRNNSLAIYTQNRKFFNVHFSRYPVIYVDFTCDVPPYDFHLAVDYLRYVVGRCFEEHRYLLKSTQLTKLEKKYVEEWISGKIGRLRVKDSLRYLSELLSIHFNGAKVYALMDEFDSGIIDCMYNMKHEEELLKIIQLNFEMLSNLFDENPCVRGGLITGTSYIAGVWVSNLTRFDVYRFLEDHRFTDFYGFTPSEVDNLFKNPVFELTKDLIADAKDYHSGYYTKTGRRLYCTWAIVNFLNERKVEDSWTMSGDVDDIRYLLNSTTFSNKIHRLIGGKKIEIRYLKDVTMEHAMKLRNILYYTDIDRSLVSTLDNEDYNLVFNHLLELGFLTYVVDSGNTFVRVPNVEIIDSIVKDLSLET